MSEPLDFTLVLQALVTREIDVEQAARAIKENPQGFGTAVLLFLERNQFNGATIGRDVGFVLELVWMVLGTDYFVKSRWPARVQLIAHHFIEAKLLAEPDEFTNDMLRYLTMASPLGQTISNMANSIQISRMAGHIRRINQQPRELSIDVKEVQRQISLYSFPADLNDLLDKVESEIGDGDAFDQASTLGRLRTFLERLHERIGLKLRERKPATIDGTRLESFGQAIDYLERKDVLTPEMNRLVAGLYGILCKEGAHAIKSEREYVRLCRNMVAEYALVLFFELDRRLSSPE